MTEDLQNVLGLRGMLTENMIFEHTKYRQPPFIKHPILNIFPWNIWETTACITFNLDMSQRVDVFISKTLRKMCEGSRQKLTP